MDLKKISIITTWPTPNLTKLHVFFGLTGFYRQLIYNYTSLATSLINLLCKDSFQWSPDVEVAFTYLKMVMTSTPILIILDFTQPFQLECVVLGFGLGVALIENFLLITYESQKLKGHELWLFTYQKEIKVTLHIVDKW